MKFYSFHVQRNKKIYFILRILKKYIIKNEHKNYNFYLQFFNFPVFLIIIYYYLLFLKYFLDIFFFFFLILENNNNDFCYIFNNNNNNTHILIIHCYFTIF